MSDENNIHSEPHVRPLLRLLACVTFEGQRLKDSLAFKREIAYAKIKSSCKEPFKVIVYARKNSRRLLRGLFLCRHQSQAGDFNNWDVGTLPMEKDSKGTWEVSFALPHGKYEYRFWVDGVWHDDPNAHERIENPFGSQNCVRIMN
jgi:Glycogen recognition site of AMP-activated protein kinase